MNETIDYIGERYPDLVDPDLRELHAVGIRFCQPAINNVPAVVVAEPAVETAVVDAVEPAVADTPEAAAEPPPSPASEVVPDPEAAQDQNGDANAA